MFVYDLGEEEQFSGNNSNNTIHFVHYGILNGPWSMPAALGPNGPWAAVH